MAADLIGIANSQILIGAGVNECQGAYNSAKAYGRTASTGVATGNTLQNILTAAWLSSNSAHSPMRFESYKNCVAVINSRTIESLDATFFPPLFPLFDGSMADGTRLEGLPTIHHRLSATTPASGDTLVMLFDPTKYLLATNFGGFQVERHEETFAATNETLFVGTVRVDGCLTHKSGVLNVTRS